MDEIFNLGQPTRTDRSRCLQVHFTSVIQSKAQIFLDEVITLMKQCDLKLYGSEDCNLLWFCPSRK